jgi:Pentatricopeptide repeat domain
MRHVLVTNLTCFGSNLTCFGNFHDVTRHPTCFGTGGYPVLGIGYWVQRATVQPTKATNLTLLPVVRIKSKVVRQTFRVIFHRVLYMSRRIRLIGWNGCWLATRQRRLLNHKATRLDSRSLVATMSTRQYPYVAPNNVPARYMTSSIDHFVTQYGSRNCDSKGNLHNFLSISPPPTLLSPLPMSRRFTPPYRLSHLPSISRRFSSDSFSSSHIKTDDTVQDAATVAVSTETESGEQSQVVKPPWKDMMSYLTRRQNKHEQLSQDSMIGNKIDENALMKLRYHNKAMGQSNFDKRGSKYNTHMNNFHHAAYPIKGPISTPQNPMKNKDIVDHPVFVMAKQLLNLTIGNFRKRDPKNHASVVETQQQKQVGNDYNSFSKNPQPQPFATLDHYQMSYNIIQFLLCDRQMCPGNNVRAINAAFAVMERLIREISYTNTYSQNIYYLLDNPVQFRTLMNYWKSSALLGGHVLPAVEMIKKIQWMIIELQRSPSKPSLIKLDKRILSILLQVMIKQLPKKQAPLVAESFMNVIYETIDATGADDDDVDSHNELHPDSIIYVQLLNAWMDSDLPQTPSKIDDVLDDMKIRSIPLDNAIYSTLIRYWGNKGSLTRIRAILERMEYENITPNVACLAQAIYGYTRSMQPLQAVQLLEQMHAKTTGATKDIVTITACTLNILDAFKRLVVRGNDVNRNVIRAEDIVRRFESNSMLKSRSEGTLVVFVVQFSS